MCVVMVGTTGYVQEYSTNPQIQFIRCKEVKGEELIRLINISTLKVVIITEGLPQWHYTWIMSLCKTRNITYLVRKSNQHVYDTIKSFFPTNGNGKVLEDDVKDTIVRGKLNALIPAIDFTKSNAENGKILFRKANELGIKTTIGSVTQFVAIQRRKQSGTALPKSARSQLDVSVDLLDDMIKNLGDMRDFLILAVEENRLLKTKLEKFKKAMED